MNQEDKTKPSEKQIGRIERLIAHLGKDEVIRYFASKFPKGDFENMTRKQAQKVITGLQVFEPRKPIYGVVGRDIPFSNERY